MAITFFVEGSDWLLTCPPLYLGVHHVLLAGLHFWTYRYVDVRTRPCSMPTAFSICRVREKREELLEGVALTIMSLRQFHVKKQRGRSWGIRPG